MPHRFPSDSAPEDLAVAQLGRAEFQFPDECQMIVCMYSLRIKVDDTI